MTTLTDIQQIKEAIQTEGAMYVLDDVWPYASFRLLVVGSRLPNMDADDFADALYKHLGIVATPLPKKADLPNLYTFITYKATPTAQLYDETLDEFVDIPLTVNLVEEYFGGEWPFVDYGVLFAAVGLEEARVSPEDAANAIVLADKFVEPSKSVEVLIPFKDTDMLAPNTWVILRTSYVSMGSIPPKGLKQMLEDYNWSYKVINPIGGISGFFERLFSAGEYVGKDYSYVLFNPGNEEGVTADSLQVAVFGAQGDKVNVSLMTTIEIIEDQGSLDLFYSVQGTEDGIGGSAKALLGMLQRLLKAFPVILWVGAGLGALWVGWKAYKYVRDEMRGG